MNKTNLNGKDDNLSQLETQFDVYESQYNMILKQYNTAYQDFMDSISSGDSKYTSYSGSVWWGDGNILQQGTASSEEDCENMCTNNPGCTGTTYNPSKQYCWTSSGQGNVVPGLDSDIAQLPASQDKLRTINSLNSQLQDLNDKLADILDQLQPYYDENGKKIDDKKVLLQNKYQSLQGEQQKLNKLIRENETLEEQYNSENLVINQQNALFKIWLFIVILLVLGTIKLFLKPTKTNNIVIIILFIIICIGLYSYLRK